MIPGQRELRTILTSYIPTAVIYDTDTTSSMRDQIELVRSARVLLVDYGSSLLVNGFFCQDSHIYVLGDFDHIHCKNPKPYFLLQDTLQRNCKYTYLPPHLPGHLIINLIANDIINGGSPFQHTYRCWKSCLECSSIL